MATQTITYTDDDTTLQGFLAFDDSYADPRPGIVVVPEGFGLGQNAKDRAVRLAKLGYVALAADPYGDGRAYTDLEAAMEAMGPLAANPVKFRQRARVAMDTLSALPQVDASKLAMIGYCMGGGLSIEMARDGAPLRGVVSFHGGLQTSKPAQAGNVKAKILVCHGVDDPMIPTKQVTDFMTEMAEAGADWQFISYGNTVHSFTNPQADGSLMPGIKYNAASDARSWQAMQNFFDEIFSD